MGRRLFEERRFNLTGRVLPYEEFRLFADIPGGFTIDDTFAEQIVKRAEKFLDSEFPMIYATDYMRFSRDGNRTVHHGKFDIRRQAVQSFALAEYVEKKGRFLDKVIDLLWMILEETTWVIPAHNRPIGGKNPNMPYNYEHPGKVEYIDLFSCATAGVVSFVYYLLKDELDAVTPLICERLLYELDRRIIKPFLDPVILRNNLGWAGLKGNRVNNWNPWIISNILTVCALTVKDKSVRETVVAQCLPILDNFTSVYHTDGGCDEGPGYWGAAGGALFTCCNLLYDLTGGYVNIYDDELLKRMGEYEIKAYIDGNRFLNFADASATIRPQLQMIYDWGVRCSSEMMMGFAMSKLGGKRVGFGVNSSHPYRVFRNLCFTSYPEGGFVAPEKFWLDGIVIAGKRECEDTSKGLYLAFKGGNNSESHNHNDVGSVIVYADGQPIFLDAGSGTYTKRTFGPERYTIWSMCSDYHNTATFNDVPQKSGGGYASSDHVYDEESGKLTMSLKNAYPENAGIVSYTRSAVLEDHRIVIEDVFELSEDGSAMLSFICDCDPEKGEGNTFSLHGRTVTYDESLVYSSEALDSTWPETEALPKRWGVEALYRVTLRTRENVKKGHYVTTVR